MPFPAAHYYVTVRGDGYNQTETWQFGLRLAATDPAAPPTQAMADGIRNAFNNAWANMFACRFLRFLGVKLTWLTPAGLIQPGFVPIFSDLAAPAAGTENPANTTHIIPQGSQVATLRTAIPRGHASHGRIFLPPVCSQLQSDGRLTAAATLNTATQVKNFIEAVNILAGVSSTVVMSNVGAGASAAVTSVQMGLVVDTHRSRRRSLGESPLQVVAVAP